MDEKRLRYKQFFCDQAGSGLPVYKGSRYMTGHGFLGRIARKAAIPLLEFFGKYFANTGLDIANDVISGRQKFKDAVKSNFKINTKKAAQDAIPLLQRTVSEFSINDNGEQVGSGATKSAAVKRKKNLRP